jgi:hypothetical protein
MKPLRREENIMSKALSNNANITIIGSKQQVSKILLAQLESEIKREAKRLIEINAEPVYGELVLSENARRMIDGHAFAFGVRGKFSIHVDRIYGLRKVTYINKDGAVSAVYSNNEWAYLRSFVREIYDEQLERVNNHAENVRQEREDARFARRVADEVERQLRNRAKAGFSSAGLKKAVAEEVERQLKNSADSADESFMNIPSKPWGDSLD